MRQSTFYTELATAYQFRYPFHQCINFLEVEATYNARAYNPKSGPGRQNLLQGFLSSQSTMSVPPGTALRLAVCAAALCAVAALPVPILIQAGPLSPNDGPQYFPNTKAGQGHAIVKVRVCTTVTSSFHVRIELTYTFLGESALVHWRRWPPPSSVLSEHRVRRARIRHRQGGFSCFHHEHY